MGVNYIILMFYKHSNAKSTSQSLIINMRIQDHLPSLISFSRDGHNPLPFQPSISSSMITHYNSPNQKQSLLLLLFQNQSHRINNFLDLFLNSLLASKHLTKMKHGHSIIFIHLAIKSTNKYLGNKHLQNQTNIFCSTGMDKQQSLLSQPYSEEKTCSVSFSYHYGHAITLSGATTQMMFGFLFSEKYFL